MYNFMTYIKNSTNNISWENADTTNYSRKEENLDKQKLGKKVVTY